MYTEAKLYAASLADRLIELTFMEFFENVHRRYYAEMDIHFLEYFLSIAQHEGEFVVPDSALVDHGVMTSQQTFERKMDDLGFVEGKDYINRSEQYLLTPEALKKSLMCAQRSAVYVDYYLLLEKMFGLYRDYQAAYNDRAKSDKIDTLLAEVANQTSVLTRIESLAVAQDAKMDQLLADAIRKLSV